MKTRQLHFREFAIASAFGFLCLVLVWIDRNDDAAREHVSLTGKLKEHEVFGRRRSLTLRFKLEGRELDFRIDPSLFRHAMDKTLPAGFEPGASVTVLIMKEEFANPDRPLLNRDMRIAWAHGLAVEGDEIFGLTETQVWESSNRRWGYALLACSLTAVVYFGIKWWQRPGGPTNRSTRSRVKRAPG